MNLSYQIILRENTVWKQIEWHFACCLLILFKLLFSWFVLPLVFLEEEFSAVAFSQSALMLAKLFFQELNYGTKFAAGFFNHKEAPSEQDVFE